MQVTDELRVLVEAEVARAIENFKKLSEGIDDSEQKSQSLGDALESLSKKSMIISGVFAGAGIAAIKFAGENEKLKLSVKNMLGSASEATAVFEDWKRLGSSPGLSADEVFSLGKALVNMGNDTQYATSTIQMLGNVAAGTSVSFGEISGTFEHVRAAGSLTTRDLVRLQQQGIPVVKQLAKEMGISEEQVRRLAAEGKLGFTDLERAFKSMTGPGGQFAGMMDELSGTVMEKFSSAADDAKQALASFGELLLPLATELLTGASSVLRGISAMDDGTRRFVLGVGGVVAVSGPVISAIKGIQAAMTAAMANPYMLAIGGIIAAAGLVGGIINKQAHAYEDLNSQIHKTKHEADDLLRSYAGGNDAKILDKEITEKLIRLYPDLAGEIKAYSMTVEDATRILDENTKAEVVNASQKQIEKLKKQAEAAENAAAAYEKFSQDVVKNIEISEKLGDAAQVKRFKEAIETYKYGWDEAAGKAEKTQREINAQLAKIGKTLGEDFAIIDIPVVLSVDTDSLYTPPEAVIKKWQEWFGEIAKVDPTLIGNSGAKAAQLYTSEFERTITAQSTIAETLGAKLDIAGVLRSRQADVQNALAELFAIDPEKIDQPFSLADESVKRLIEEYKRLGAEAKRLEDSLTVTNTLDDLSQKVQNLGKDQYDLALATMAAANATEEEIKRAKELINTLREADNVIKNLSFEEFLSDKIKVKLLETFMELEYYAAEAIGNISAQFSMMSFDGLLNGLSAIGEAFGKGENAAENLRQAMADMAQQILNQLPGMFLQAGLQLIAQGQWPLGLGFIAAAGSSAIIGGYVKGATGKEQDVTANAHGNVFNAEGIQAFARGGTFTNQIVEKPTLFKFARGTGLMGEAGPEAIMPLKRMTNGDLGIQTAGGGANVTVNVINNSGAEVRQEEHESADGGKQIDVIIGDMINRHIASGKADRVMNGRYGQRALGV